MCDINNKYTSAHCHLAEYEESNMQHDTPPASSPTVSSLSLRQFLLHLLGQCLWHRFLCRADRDSIHLSHTVSSYSLHSLTGKQLTDLS